MFIIANRDTFVSQCLPLYAMSPKFDTFNRQLLLYGFKKVSSRRKAKEVTYAHPYFRSGQFQLMKFIKRKKQVAPQKKKVDIKGKSIGRNQSKLIRKPTRSLSDLQDPP